ncbi:asparagine synthase (glutamine-hydrolyzing) [Magnetospirillum sp. SS-4]|uniref:asparagine synthase (glutamine-hydrolyzing) n=1 Tax=Magnetospirillum sp. SS-4 TaxID=2681465 RepID=UPI0013805AC7|nr:asparagine synthase (glutamine-hydrolyzing) [Magnetospirillum sp. SS-4]CAA7617701.1 Asparagine synthetase [Magnetospirillum sp. SS-4]
MCGIAGLLDHRAPASRKALKAMASAMAHRGPDGEGVHVDGGLGLAFRRLAILDLSDAADQPMTSPDGRHVIVHNGEVYNFRDLRRELEAEGIRFRSTGDTEVVLHALIRWGEAAIERFNGMFALAWWDSARRELLLARDRYGAKPLYWRNGSGPFLFGSEIKAILAHPDAGAGLDPEGLLEYLTFQNFLGERTLFKGIRMLPAGTTLRIAGDGVPRIRRYWDFSFRPDPGLCSEATALDLLEERFSTAVERQLVSDVDIGGYLSGGIDTGLITAFAAPRLDGMRSYTVGFDLHSASGLELGCDERRPAELMSYLAQTEHYEMVLKAGDMARALPAVVRHLEEPRVGQSYPNFYAAKLAGKFAKVVLSGTGGDELFAGYPWRYRAARWGGGLDGFIDSYFGQWQRLVPPERMNDLLAPIRGQVSHLSPRDIFADTFPAGTQAPASAEDAINLCLYFEAKTFLHGLLVVEDKLGMAHGLESRFPFLDNDLVDLACRLPVSMKLRRLDHIPEQNENEPGAKKHSYFQRTNDGKLLVRRLAARRMPAAIAEAEKQGFSAPDASWFRGESIDFVRSTLLEESSELYNVLDRATVLSLVNEHLNGTVNRRLLIWSLLCLDQWLKIWK